MSRLGLTVGGALGVHVCCCTDSCPITSCTPQESWSAALKQRFKNVRRKSRYQAMGLKYIPPSKRRNLSKDGITGGGSPPLQPEAMPPTQHASTIPAQSPAVEQQQQEPLSQPEDR